MTHDYGLTKEQRANLAKLADYLETQAQPETFGMREFYYWPGGEDDDDHWLSYDDPTAESHPCGTAACAVGHGPSAGVAVMTEDQDWWGYAARAFGAHGRIVNAVWASCFSFAWAAVDNTPTGAAVRIRHVLDGKEPLQPPMSEDEHF
jgi:hypothetical protein